MDDSSPRRSSVFSTVLVVLSSLVGIAFLPLLLAAAEAATVGGHRVEDVCKRMGVHGFLDAIYRPILRLFDFL